VTTATGTEAPPRPSVTRAFGAVLWRDVYVTGRELPTFVAQVVLQPLFLLFVFGRILTQLGYADESYADLLFPGILALTAVLTGVQGTAFPLVIDFSFTKEIEDRLLAPMPVSLVAVEKILFAATRSLVAALVMFPIGVWVLGSIPWQSENWAWVAAFLLLGCVLGASMGMTLGTAVPPNRINVVFALVLTPLLFTGASQYPWPSLESLRWFQVVTALNPMTYVSEGLRGAMTPDVPHIAPWVCLVVLAGAVGLFGWLGIRGFRRRAID
jgi:ABC-2 type transport system permease protein